MKNLTRQNPGQLFVAQELINKVKSKCCGIKGLIIIPASVALPNRYIPISNTRIHTGKVVDKTRSKMPTKTTGGWQNYVKIKIDGENTYFWYNLWNETKNDGAKCILYERKGIWGLSYVTNVNFIVE